MDSAKAQNWRILDEIFDEILDAPPEQKAEILKRRCGADADLRQKVEKMLASVETDEDFLETPMFEDAFRVFETETSDALIGQKLGNYTILEHLGQGGMGAVYLGERDDKEFRQRVAIKIVAPIFTDKANSENFRRERQILAKLNHPAIARLLDGGTMENGAPFLVMEFVEGIALTEFCARKNLSVKQRLSLFLEVCEAVKFAHQNLIIHRDLKPANILVTAEGKPKLLDFGVAKLLQPELLDITTDFTVGANILTPNYASPEQLKGENITTASDVYSLGVILYEILTGKRPHNLKSKSLPDILKIITEEIPNSPSYVLSENPQSTIPNPQSLKGDIDTIVLKSLAKDSRERYQTVGEFCADIVRYLNDLPILARKPSRIYQLKKFARRNKVAVISGLVIFLLLSTLLGTAIYSARVAQRQARENLRQAYSSDMNLAMESYETANLVRLGQILEKYKDVDFRGWEYGFLQNLANPKGRILSLAHSAEVWNVAFSPDSRRLATACGDGFARIFEVPSGKLLTQTAVREKNIWRIRFSPDGKFFATASGDSASSSVKILNTETGAEIRSFVGHIARVRAIDFAPDGKTFATGGADSIIKIWQISDGKLLETITGNAGFTQALTYTPDGKRLVSASGDGVIRVRDTETKAQVLAIRTNSSITNFLAFTPDGKTLISHGTQEKVRVWESLSEK